MKPLVLRQRSSSVRIASFGAALLLTLGPLVAVYGPRPLSTAAPASPVSHYITLFPRVETPPAVVMPDRRAAPTASARSTPRLPRPPISAITAPQAAALPADPTAITLVPTPPETPEASVTTASAEPPQPAASQPLKLDAQTLSTAARASRSGLRQLAEAGTGTLGSEPLSESERLAQSVAKTGKSDCLGANAGGSLLSVFVIAFQAAKGQCK